LELEKSGKSEKKWKLGFYIFVRVVTENPKFLLFLKVDRVFLAISRIL